MSYPALRRLLSEAGYPNGFSFTIKTPQMAYAHAARR